MNMFHIIQTGKFSIIVPVFNLEKHIEYFNNNLIHTLKDMDYNIIYIDDFSTDNSLAKLNLIKEKNKNIIVLENNVNIGQQKSIYRGLEIINNNFSIIMDGDNQDDPKYIFELISKFNSHKTKKAIFQIRFNDFENKVKKINSILFYSISSLIFGIDKNKVANNYKLLPQSLIVELLKNKDKTYIVNLDIFKLADNLNYEYISIPGMKKERISDKSSSYSKIKLFKHLGKTYLEAYKIKKRRVNFIILVSLMLIILTIIK